MSEELLKTQRHRERDVLDNMTASVGSAQMARLLNLKFVRVVRNGKESFRILNRPCEWCPVLPPREGERIAVVPRSSRDKVHRVLESLVRSGRLKKWSHRRGRMFYFKAEGS